MLKQKKVRVLGIALISIILLGLGVTGYIYRDRLRNDEAVNNSEEIVEIDIDQKVEATKDSALERYMQDAENTNYSVDERANAYLSASEFYRQQSELDKALEYALLAKDFEGLSSQTRLNISIHLAGVYHAKGEYDKGLEELNNSRADTEIMSLEFAEASIARMESFLSSRTEITPINCQDPQEPKDCPYAI